MLAHDMARAAGGEFLLRIEDIDQSRTRPEWEDLIYEDLTWLGVTWDGPVLRQSDRLDRYRQAIKDLWDTSLLFECICSRRDVLEAASAPNEGTPPFGPDGVIYPGTCRDRKKDGVRIAPAAAAALRLDMTAAAARTGPVGFDDTGETLRPPPFP